LKCPECGKSWIAEIFWGYPADIESMEDILEKKEIVLGGCIVTDHDPRWECNHCNYKWGERDE
jgi:ribosomal protein S27AE